MGNEILSAAAEDVAERFRVSASAKRRPVGNLCGSADSARGLLEKIPTPDTILAGHSLIAGLV